MLVIFMVISAAFSMFSGGDKNVESVSVSAITEGINNDKVEKIEVSANRLLVFLKDGSKQSSIKESEIALTESLINYGVDAEKLKAVQVVVTEPSASSAFFSTILPFLLPFLLIGAFIWFLLRQMSGSNNRAMSFGQSGAKLMDENDKRRKITFADVAGIKEAKEELKEVVEFLRFPQKFFALGAKIPKGVLLLGSPGVGKESETEFAMHCVH
jgi:cell division protease FtsH